LNNFTRGVAASFDRLRMAVDRLRMAVDRLRMVVTLSSSRPELVEGSKGDPPCQHADKGPLFSILKVLMEN
jgi:hypothetical protein